jgi:chromosome segregation ATPase
MSAELSEHLAGWQSVRSALTEVRAVHGEFRHFFSDVFDQLGAMLAELAGRKNQWEAEQRQAEGELARKAARLQEDRAALAARRECDGQDAPLSVEASRQLERLLEDAEQQRAEIRDAQQQFRAELSRLADAAGGTQLAQVLEEIRQQRAQLHNTEEAAQQRAEQLSEVGTKLADVHGQLVETRNEIAQRWTQLEACQTSADQAEPDEELDERFRQLQSRQALLEQERAVLESELEVVRNRAAEMAQLLGEQKQQATAQQAEWAKELKRMRRLLEGIAVRLVEDQRFEGALRPDSLQPAGAAAAGPAAAGGDPVLDSVAAQFEMLQKDLAKRRAAKSAPQGVS